MCVRNMMHVGMYISMLKSTVCIYMYNCLRMFLYKYISVCENVSEFVSVCVCSRAPVFIYSIPLVRRECECENALICTHIDLSIYLCV